MFGKFIWNDKKPTVNRTKMHMSRDNGGLGLPDLYKYYIAFNIRYPLEWGLKLRETVWEAMEREILDNMEDKISLEGLWYSPIKQKTTENPLIKFSC